MKLTKAEWQIMNALWEDHPATARDIMDRLPTGVKWAYTTIKTMLTRLVEKKAVSETKLYSWEKASAEAADGKWADHVHIFRTLPGTERITVTVFLHRPGTWWLDDVSLTEL